MNEMRESSSSQTPIAAYTAEVLRTGHWPFAWGFVIRKDGEFVCGQKNIESRRATQKDADDMVARLNDGRLVVDQHGNVYAPSGGRS